MSLCWSTRVWLLSLVWATGVGLAACAGSYRRSRPDLPLRERGATELSALYDDFLVVMAKGDFDTAEAILAEIEQGVKDADGATIMHWKYRRVSEGATDGRRKLGRARRKHTVGSYSGETERRLVRSETLLTELSEQGPSEARLTEVAELIGELQALAEKGREYAGRDGPVALLLPEIERTGAALKEAQPVFRWLLDLSVPLEAALAPIAAPAPEEIPAALEHAERAVAALGECRRLIAAAGTVPDYSPRITVALVFGRFEIPVAARVCAVERRAYEDRVALFGWRRDVEEVASWVSEALVDIESREDPTEILGANERAVQTLTACEERLRDTEAHPGFVAGMEFANHMGEMTATKLRESCAKVHGRLESQRATLRWRLDKDALQQWIGEVRERAKALSEQAGEAEKAGLAELIPSFDECAERAAALASIADPSWQDARPTRRELKGMAALAGMCRKERAYFERAER